MKRILALILATALCATLVPIGTAAGSGGVAWAQRMIPGLDGDILSVWMSGDGEDMHVLEHNSPQNWLWTTENDGATWSKSLIYPTGTLMLPGDTFKINDIDFSWDGTKGWAVGMFSDWKGGLTYEHSPFILYTADSGATWTNQTGNIDTDMTGLLGLNAVHYFTGGIVYACGENGAFLATDDWGSTWEAVNHSDGSYNFTDVTGGYTTGAYRVVCVGNNGGNEGQILTWGKPIAGPSSWSSAFIRVTGSARPSLEAVVWADTDYDRLLTVGLDGVYGWSNDEGNTWTFSDTGAEDWYGLDYQNSTTAFAVGDYGAIQGFTYSAIDTWQYVGVDTGSPPAGVSQQFNDIRASWTGKLWAVGDSAQIAERKASTTTRVADDNRYTTAIAMSKDWPDNSVDAVVVATGLDFPDALSASGLAGAYECPLLLAGPTMTTEIANELTRLNPDKVVIVGGTGAVSTSFENSVNNSLGLTTERLSGDDRYHTSRLVATEISTIMGSDFAKMAFIVRGDGFADALAVSPFAYSQKFPVLLTATNHVPPHTNAALSLLDIENGVIAGGTSAVSAPTAAVVDAIMGVNGGGGTMRWAGANRYETAAKVAEDGCFWGWGTPGFIGLATGTNFPDALGGGAVAGSAGGALLLTDGSSLSPETEAFLQKYSTRIRELEVFGGKSAVSDAVMNAADAAIY